MPDEAMWADRSSLLAPPSSVPSIVLRGCLWVVLFGFVSAARGDEGEGNLLASPDGRIAVSIQMPALGSREPPRWSAAFRRKQVLRDCRLGLQTADAGDLMSGARVLRERRHSRDERVQVPFGRFDHARDRFQEIRFTLENADRWRVDVVFRCYDDAIALRYELPAGAQRRVVTITDETTSFRVEGDPTAYIQVLENYKTSHEHNVNPIRYADIQPGALLDMPLTLVWTDGACAALTEAALRRYAGMSLMRSVDDGSPSRLVCKLTPRPDGTKVVRSLPLRTPWRVVLLGERPGALLESTTLYCLNEPSAIKDVSWIRPGKITFHWWNGDVYDGQPGSPMLSLEMDQEVHRLLRARRDSHALDNFDRGNHLAVVSPNQAGSRAGTRHRRDSSAR